MLKVTVLLVLALLSGAFKTVREKCNAVANNATREGRSMILARSLKRQPAQLVESSLTKTLFNSVHARNDDKLKIPHAWVLQYVNPKWKFNAQDRKTDEYNWESIDDFTKCRAAVAAEKVRPKLDLRPAAATAFVVFFVVCDCAALRPRK